MDYLWIKALHIVAVVTWIGGMLVVAVTIAAVADVRGQQEIATRSAFLECVRRWDQRVTSPAMLLVWILGLTLALTGNWFPQTWLLAKLALVLLLSALHGVLSGRLHRLSRSQVPSSPAALRYAGAAVVIATLIIVVLVVTKPI
ncbi:CopD family protein [Hyphomicrobium sp. 2TAF46]|uniref:CopD family protein n=1 Tax=Hyphomicrobium sp. 2TAF46 TaxID=3233019 RepID=UPI003F92B549